MSNPENHNTPASSGGPFSVPKAEEHASQDKGEPQVENRVDRTQSATASESQTRPVSQMTTAVPPKRGKRAIVRRPLPMLGSGAERVATPESKGTAMSGPSKTGTCTPSDSGESQKIIEKEKIHGIDADVYQKIVEVIGKPIPRERKINTNLAAKMHDAGWSYKQIGKYFKVSGCTVRRRLREVGLR